MKNKKDISSLKGLRINGWSYLLQTFWGCIKRHF